MRKTPGCTGKLKRESRGEYASGIIALDIWVGAGVRTNPVGSIRDLSGETLEASQGVTKEPSSDVTACEP